MAQTVRQPRAATDRGPAALSARDAEMARPVTDFIHAINRGDVDQAVALLRPDALHRGAVSDYTPDGVRVLFNMLLELFSDLHIDIVEQRVVGTRVMSRLVITGTHTGSYLGKPATGQPVAWQSLDVAEVEDLPAVDEAGTGETATGASPEWDMRRILKRFWDIWSDPELFKRIGFRPGIGC